MGRAVIVGAVAYDPRVVTIWEGIRDYFHGVGLPTDYVLFSNYDSQVDALLSGALDIAWNTNVAYARCEQRANGGCRVLAMRNTDLDFRTRLVTRKGSGISAIGDLAGRRLALGSTDSAQAAIMPLHFMRQSGIDPEAEVQILHFDIDVGKHGDTGSSELEVLRAVHEGRADAGMVGHATWLRELEMGRVNSGVVESVWTSPPYDHCNFTALPDFDPSLAADWADALLQMDYGDERWRRVMDLEGVSRWVRGRKEGYRPVLEALGVEVK
ncbi:MAG: phosphate/phosphite/phosphonate ABC transporter substrate-binding protein [Chloroflexi bacterium]|nr:MAG: phosphate/phosphite/phosphonate ABC transporter substrate-binding protein [Chloroflexota bacterium]